MTTSTDPTNTPDDTPSDLVPTSSPTSSQQGPGHRRDDLVPQSPSPTEGDEVSEPPRPRPGTTSRARPEPHGPGAAGETPWVEGRTTHEQTRVLAVSLAGALRKHTSYGHHVALAYELLDDFDELARLRSELDEVRIQLARHRTAVVDEIRETGIYQANLPGLLRAAELLQIPGAADAPGRGGQG